MSQSVIGATICYYYTYCTIGSFIYWSICPFFLPSIFHPEFHLFSIPNFMHIFWYLSTFNSSHIAAHPSFEGFGNKSPYSLTLQYSYQQTKQKKRALRQSSSHKFLQSALSMDFSIFPPSFKRLYNNSPENSPSCP